MNYFVGQRVITTHGTVRTIAVICGSDIYAYGMAGELELVTPRYEAWGGEHDPEMRNAA